MYPRFLPQEINKFAEMLNSFDEREKDIIVQRYVLGRTLPFLAKKYNLTLERVRQIQNKAIKKARKFI